MANITVRGGAKGGDKNFRKKEKKFIQYAFLS